MDDLISRRAAIEAMSESLKRVFPEHRQIAEKCLKALPSAQPEPLVKESRTLVKDLVKDTISRQAAIDAMAELQGRASTKAELKGISKAWKRIKQLPSAQPEPQWIPVSERLPENDDAVLISHKHGVGKAWWNGRFWSSATKKCYKTVTAWMPLPEPYRAERRTDAV